MAQVAQTVLVADSDDDRRRELGLALHAGGFEVINAVNGEEALRFAAGLDPTLLVVHTALTQIPPLELRERLGATGLHVPPFLILFDSDEELPEEPAEGALYFLNTDSTDSDRLLQQVRLLLLARDIGGDLGEKIDTLYGDLTRASIGDVLRMLKKHLITGHISLGVGTEAVGIWMDDGTVIDAHWGDIHGLKAFNRIAGLRGGAFTLTVGEVNVERTIEKELASLVTDAVDDHLEFEELLRKLPPLSSGMQLRVGDAIFEGEFEPIEKKVLTAVQQCKTLGDLIDRVDAPDAAVARTVLDLQERGMLVLELPSRVIHVVTDSTADLPPALARRMDLTVVPLSVLFGRTVYRDGVDLKPDEFYQKLQKSDTLPSTSPPGKGEFLETYRRLIGTGDVLSIHISKRQSKTALHAEQAVEEGREELGEIRKKAGLAGEPRIRVVDSRFNSVSLGLLTIIARRLVGKGLELDAVVDRLEQIRERFQFMFVVDTLEYLKKGGRIGGAQAWFGTLLGIKPILGMSEGEVVPVERVRGGRNVQPRMIELFQERLEKGRPVMAATAHASAPKWGRRLRTLLEESFDVVELVEGEIGPVIGTHVGPGCVGACLFQPTDEELELIGLER